MSDIKPQTWSCGHCGKNHPDEDCIDYIQRKEREDAQRRNGGWGEEPQTPW